jgi:hypothetical protein
LIDGRVFEHFHTIDELVVDLVGKTGLERITSFRNDNHLTIHILKPNSSSTRPLKIFRFEAVVESLGLEGLRPDPCLGRLSFKEEAAGKLRVFAMVDSWTQSIFKPLHDSLFQVLSRLPNDSTFDQGKAFQRALSKAEKYGHSYGYDLSAATDRLPLILQIKLLSGLIGGHLASLWGLILTERDYRLPVNKYEIPTGYLRYTVGQPMGALSS